MAELKRWSKVPLRNLTYFSILGGTLVVYAIAWATHGFQDFGASEKTPLLPFFWGFVLFGLIFEPLLLHNSLSMKIEEKTYSSLALRALIAGVVISVIWTALIAIGKRSPGLEFVWLGIAFISALAVGAMAVTIGSKRQNLSSQPTPSGRG